MAWRFVLISCLLSFTSLRAQNFSFVNYGFNQGLHHIQIIDITQDVYGNLWALPLTGSVLYRFDGRHFQKVNVTIEGVHQSFRLFRIAADKEENIWLITSIGLVRYDGKRFHHIPFDIPTQFSRQSTIYVDRYSIVWIIDDNGNVFSCNGNAATSVQYGSMNGRPIGFSEINNDVFVFSNKAEQISLSTKKPVTLSWLKPEDRLAYITLDGDDYLALTRSEIIRYNNKEKTVKRYPHQFPAIQQMVTYNENILVLSQGSISLINEQGTKVIEDYPGFDNRFVQELFKGRLNSIWLGTDGQGIFNLAKQKTMNIPIPGNDIPVAVYPVDDNKLLLGTYKKGLVEIEGTKVKDLGVREVQAQVVMTVVKGPGNTILVGTQQGGAYVLSGNRISKLSMGKVNPPFVLPITTMNDEVWIGSSFGLHRFSNSLKHIRNYSYQQLGVVSHFNFIHPLDSTLLIGSAGDGLLEFSPKTGELRKLAGYQRESGVYMVKRDAAGRLWLGGEFPRILVLDKQLKRIAEIDLGKYCSNVLAFEFFGRDRLLVGSNDGIFTITLGDGYRLSSIRRLGLADGYRGGEVCMASMTRVKDKIWFGTSDGIYCYFIDSDKDNNPTPFTYINDVRLFNQETDWRDYSDKVSGMYGLPSDLELKHGNNSLTFSFYANDFHDNEDLQFHYWLEGSDAGWSEYSTAENITYSALPAGKYTFHVQSKDGVNSGNIARFSFVILPAFWETTTFYVSVAAATALIIFVLIRIITRFRIKRFQLKEQIRATESARLRRQMAMDFHDEMGNKLASVLAYSSSLKLVSGDKENHELFDYFEKSAAAIYYGTKDFIWSIDVESNNLVEVITYLRDFGANFFEKHNIDFLVENDILNESFNRALPDGYNRQLVLLFKEAMTNVLKHSKASKVYFDVSVINGTYKIRLEDNGIGIMREGRGKGLKSMADRADKIGGHLSIEAVEPHGTRITLQFKV